ncbi:MAG: GTPase ObgE [bacterium]
MALLDEVQLYIKAGRGGDGVVRWRQEKGKPLSGPGGGNGGTGGDVFAYAVPDIGYLDFYRTKKNFAAENGFPGANWGRKGANGTDLVLSFPVGSRLINKETGEIFELEEVGQKTLVLKGGRGGLGNEYFKSSRNTTPKECTPGKIGEDATFDIELRLVANLGLVGLPSAGKSSLLNALTNAKSKVASYHFTTLDPHLGAFYEFIIADIPGIIEGASEGKGLGVKFLKHVSKTKALAHVVALDSDDLVRDYQTIRTEIENYGQGLQHKDEVIIFSKSDIIEDDELKAKLKSMAKITQGKLFFVVSIENPEQMKELSDGLVKYLRQ